MSLVSSVCQSYKYTCGYIIHKPRQPTQSNRGLSQDARLILPLPPGQEGELGERRRAHTEVLFEQPFGDDCKQPEGGLIRGGIVCVCICGHVITTLAITKMQWRILMSLLSDTVLRIVKNATNTHPYTHTNNAHPHSHMYPTVFKESHLFFANWHHTTFSYIKLDDSALCRYRSNRLLSFIFFIFKHTSWHSHLPQRWVIRCTLHCLQLVQLKLNCPLFFIIILLSD